MQTAQQLSLFQHVTQVYLSHAVQALTNQELYARVAERAGIPEADLHATVPVGKTGAPHSPIKRTIRWAQQTLKQLNLITHVPGTRGIWQLTEPARNDLHLAKSHVTLIAFSTTLGMAIWGSHNAVFPRLDLPITLCVTSPPYPLRHPRAYGNPKEHEYVDFICHALEPIVKHLVPGGSICLNLSNDIFSSGSPDRSLYRERTILALCDRFGLKKMDEIVWLNPTKAPGPVEWASKRRVQLNVAWEPIYWLTNDPQRVKADNRRVLRPHTERHRQFLTRGGEHRTAQYGDGAYTVKPGSFHRPTAGAIPRNVLQMTHTCADSRQYRRDALRLGVPAHGAMQPLALPKFLIQFLSEPGDLVVDVFGGAITTGKAAEELGRHWLACEWILEFIRGAAERFRHAPGFHLHPLLTTL